MASVRKRTWDHNGEAKEAWVVSYTDQGGKRRLKTFDKKKVADQHRLLVEKELEAGVHQPSTASITFAKAYDLWIRDCERRWKIKDGITGNGYHSYEQNGRLHVLPALGTTPLAKLSHLTVQDLINSKSTKLGVSGLTKMMIVIRQVLAFALERNLIYVDPMAGRVIRLPNGPKPEKRIPSKEEIRRIFESLAERGKGEFRTGWRNRIALVTLSLFAGLRRGEICGLQWENIDFETSTIIVKHSLSHYDGLKGPKTKAGYRRIPMADPVLQMLQWIAGETAEPRSGYLLRGRGGVPLPVQSLSATYWLPLMRRAGLLNSNGRPKYSIHAMRHTTASMLIQQGLDAFVLKGIMGHATVSVTYDTYGHMFDDDARGVKAVHDAANGMSVLSHIPALTASTRQPRDTAMQVIDNADLSHATIARISNLKK